MNENKKNEAKQEIEQYFIQNNIQYQKNPIIIGRFNPDFVIKDNITVEVKYIENEKNALDPSTERVNIYNAIIRNALLNKIYPGKYKNVLIIKRKFESASSANFLHNNLLFDLFIPSHHLEFFKKYIDGANREMIFFALLDTLYEEDWSKRDTHFPAVIYGFLKSIDEKKIKTVTQYVKISKYGVSAQVYLSSVMSILQKLNIIKKEKEGRNVIITIMNKKWRHFVYLNLLCQGKFDSIPVENLLDIFNKICKLFE